MSQRQASLWFGIALAVVVPGLSDRAAAQSAASHVGDISQAIRLDHEETIRHLTAISSRKTPVGPIAKEALAVVRKHHADELAFILPPLVLLQSLADGKVSNDMRWAIAMADRVKSEKEAIFATHAKITDLMNKLLLAAEKVHDRDAIEFAESAVTDSLSDMELQEPMTLLIGEYLRAKLPPGP